MLFGFETIGCHERTHCLYCFEGVDVKFFAQFSFQFFGGRIPVPEWVFTEVIGDSFYYLFVGSTDFNNSVMSDGPGGKGEFPATENYPGSGAAGL